MRLLAIGWFVSPSICPSDNTRVVLGRWPEHAAWLLVGTEFEDDWNYWIVLPFGSWTIDRMVPWWGRFAA
jgi:hypothetical protein